VCSSATVLYMILDHSDKQGANNVLYMFTMLSFQYYRSKLICTGKYNKDYNIFCNVGMFCCIKLNMFMHIAHQISEGCVIRVLVCLPETVRICIICISCCIIIIIIIIVTEFPKKFVHNQVLYQCQIRIPLCTFPSFGPPIQRFF
jgi:hypothetical protein